MISYYYKANQHLNLTLMYRSIFLRLEKSTVV